ncbi:hypothetical protein KOR42_52850 [Thalassoglobus neptunius]|uniref:Uncharacterized protein n=1 Tax=Thalassoglobus neptunius TaxID=1938619 RepID=A0A5C5V8Z2_9PLAN|nr:hypothetical protein KOR42_52850 [Thalassoglobus neptunius]
MLQYLRICALCAGVLFWGTLSRDACATCGDWLAEAGSHQTFHGMLSPDGFDQLQTVSSWNGTASRLIEAKRSLSLDRLLDSQPEGSQGCNGPSCRQLPPKPIAPIPSVVEVQSFEPFLVQLLALTQTDSSHRWGFLAGKLQGLSGYRSDLERPPQSLSC